MAKHLTDKFVEKVTDAKEYWDSEIHGFFLRVSEGGTKTFAAFYRHNKRQRKITIGTFPTFSVKQAREAAADYLRDAKAGDDPQAEKKAKHDAISFGDLCDAYLEGHAAVHKRASSVYADERMIKSDLAAWRNLKAEDLTNADVSALLNKIVRRGAKIKANRTLALLSKIFRYSIGTGMLPRTTVSPTYLVPRPAKECSRDRWLDDAEIRKLWLALEHKPAKTAAWFKLLLLTGQRCREVLTMQKSEVDFEMAEWTVPANCEDHKAQRENLVPLSPAALSLVESLKSEHPYIFSARSVKPAPIREYKSWVNAMRDELKLADWTAHDLRRTVQTNLTKMGVSRFIADKITNHADNTVGGTYDRYAYKDEKRAAMQAWEAKLLKLVA